MNLKNSASGDYGVRLNQPAMMVQTRCRWFIGDVTEVLDQNTWKLGKIAKMLKNNYFVIRLADCIQLKEFHITSLRVPLQDDPPTAAPYGKQFPASDKVSANQLSMLMVHFTMDMIISQMSRSVNSCFV